MQNASQKLTLYVDGACRGNPGGVGGWGALIIDDQNNKRELFGGELDTTNNRMELTAAIEGVLACDPNDYLIIYTDSTYVQKGITEWIIGWKKKNWKDVKNPDLWKKLDQACQGRQIEWHWIKGHAGHAGNERADQLANLGADQASTHQAATPSTTVPTTQLFNESKDLAPEATDWLLDDPFGLGEFEEHSDDNHESEDNHKSEDHHAEIIEPQVQPQDATVALTSDAPMAESVNDLPTQATTQTITPINAQIKITPTTNPQQGERLLILDTETTGFYYQNGDRIIEVGAIEMINRRLTGSSIHIYINPQKPVGESENIHGISDDFLKDKPLFNDISQTLYEYLKGAEIVAHNATFDMNFLNMEFERAQFGKLSDVCTVTDTLAVAKRKFPGQKNSLDALVRRLEIPARDRTFHGALLDAEILADVYLAMTGGQVSLDIDALSQEHQNAESNLISAQQVTEVPIILPLEDEMTAHQTWMDKHREKNKQATLFEQYTST